MAIQIELMEGIRYTSYVINAVVIYYWFKQRVLLNNFLAGRWEGVLASSENLSSTVYHCVLYMANRKGNDNTGYLYYFQKDLKSGDTPAKGLDELVEYDNNVFVFGRSWNPRFMRVFHKESGEDTDGLPLLYRWKCEITSIFFSEQMHVKISLEGHNAEFSGILRKH